MRAFLAFSAVFLMSAAVEAGGYGYSLNSNGTMTQYWNHGNYGWYQNSNGGSGQFYNSNYGDGYRQMWRPQVYAPIPIYYYQPVEVPVYQTVPGYRPIPLSRMPVGRLAQPRR
jgi:hypothetical protein